MPTTDQRAARRAAAAERARRQREQTSPAAAQLLAVQCAATLEQLDRLGRAAERAGGVPADVRRALVKLAAWCAEHAGGA